MTAQQFLKKFTTKKDALTAVEIFIAQLETKVPYDATTETLVIEWLKLKKEIESFTDKDLAQEVMDFLNDQFGTQYRNAENIKTIIRNYPRVTFDHFASVIMHKKETWGKDPKMQDYLRPATLFGSVNKFKIYLDDATNHWIKKAKHDSQGKI